MAVSPIDRIVKMLDDGAPERQLAAIIVLGELKSKAAVKPLTSILEGGAPALQRHALEALKSIGITRSGLVALWPLLGSRDANVRNAAIDTIASVGESVVSDVRRRLSDAEGDQRRALESVLSRLGGKEAFDVLLEALAAGDEEANRATALELRRHVRDAEPSIRRGYRARIESLLERRGLREAAMASAVKVLGYLEDKKSAPVLLALAKDSRRSAAVRQEALIALRFTMRDGATDAVVQALVGAALADDRALAQTALMTLIAMELPASLAAPLTQLALHKDIERARMAIEKLGSLGGGKATETLIEIVKRGDKRRAELAAAALEARKDALAPLVTLFASADELERSRLLRRALESRHDELTGPMRARLLDAAVEALVSGADVAEPRLAVASDSGAKLGPRLRKEAAKLRKARKLDAEARVLGALSGAGEARPEERYRLAAVLLRGSSLDPRARRSDRSLRLLAELAKTDFDVASAMRSDRGVELDALYYVGFCFLEDGVDGGEDLMRDVVKRGGRKKIATAAKNKLALAGLA